MGHNRAPAAPSYKKKEKANRVTNARTPAHFMHFGRAAPMRRCERSFSVITNIFHTRQASSQCFSRGFHSTDKISTARRFCVTDYSFDVMDESEQFVEYITVMLARVSVEVEVRIADSWKTFIDFNYMRHCYSFVFTRLCGTGMRSNWNVFAHSDRSCRNALDAFDVPSAQTPGRGVVREI